MLFISFRSPHDTVIRDCDNFTIISLPPEDSYTPTESVALSSVLIAAKHARVMYGLLNKKEVLPQDWLLSQQFIDFMQSQAHHTKSHRPHKQLVARALSKLLDKLENDRLQQLREETARLQERQRQIGNTPFSRNCSSQEQEGKLIASEIGVPALRSASGQYVGTAAQALAAEAHLPTSQVALAAIGAGSGGHKASHCTGSISTNKAAIELRRTKYQECLRNQIFSDPSMKQEFLRGIGGRPSQFVTNTGPLIDAFADAALQGHRIQDIFEDVTNQQGLIAVRLKSDWRRNLDASYLSLLDPKQYGSAFRVEGGKQHDQPVIQHTHHEDSHTQRTFPALTERSFSAAFQEGSLVFSRHSDGTEDLVNLSTKENSWFSSKPMLMLQEDAPVGKSGEYVKIIDVNPSMPDHFRVLMKDCKRIMSIHYQCFVIAGCYTPSPTEESSSTFASTRFHKNN